MQNPPRLLLDSSCDLSRVPSPSNFQATCRPVRSFLGRLAQVRKTEQENWQENCYRRQEQTPSMYTQYELLFREDVSEKIRALGKDYLAKE